MTNEERKHPLFDYPDLINAAKFNPTLNFWLETGRDLFKLMEYSPEYVASNMPIVEEAVTEIRYRLLR